MATVTINLTNVQATLVSGTNIKTVNGSSLLGSGDLTTADSSIGVADQTITDASRVVTLAGDTLSEYITFENDSGTDFFQVTGAKTAYLGEYYAPTATDRLVVGTVGMTNGVHVKGTGDNGIYVANTGNYGVLTSGSNKQAIKGTSSTGTGTGIIGEVTASTGTNIGLQGVANTANTGTNKALEVSATNGATNYAIEVTAGDIKISQATQNITLNGNTSSETLIFEKADGTDVMTIAGDGNVSIPNGELQLGADFNAKATLLGTGKNYGVYTTGSPASGSFISDATTPKHFYANGLTGGEVGFYIDSSGTHSSNVIGFQSFISNSNSLDNTGIKLNAINTGSGGAYAIDIIAGDINTNSGNTDILLGGATSSDKISFSNSTDEVLVVQGNGEVYANGRGLIASNTAFGEGTLNASTTGGNNTVFGKNTGKNLTTGQINTAFGNNTLTDCTTGGNNVALGQYALDNISTTDGNVGLGSQAGRFITGGSTPNITGEKSIFVGRSTKAKADGETNQIVIGDATTGNGSNTVTIGNSSTTDNYIMGDFNTQSGTTNFITGGDTSSDTINFENASGTDVMTVSGDGTIGMGTAPSSTATVKLSSSLSYGMLIQGTATNGIFGTSSKSGANGVRATVTGATGTNRAMRAQATTTNTGTNIGLDIDCSGGANNYALRINSGDLITPSGTGQTGTYTFGGGGSGDIATMQFENGILIATTTVP